MSNIATGINKKLTACIQPGLGQAANVASGFLLRRTQSTLDLKKATYGSKELRTSQQRADFRHGIRSVDGSISGELSVGTYQQFVESVLRQDALAAITATASDIVAASTGTNTGTLTTTVGSFLAGNKFKIGMVVRATGFAAPATANNGANLIITALTDKIMTVARLDGQPVVARVETAAVTIATPGKYTYVPQSGHTRDYYTIEHYFGDLTPAQSERFTDCVISQMDVKMPASGMGTIDFSVMGLNMVTTSGASYFTNPAATSTGSTLASANGAVYLGGVAIGLITGMNFSVKGNYSTPDGIVGSNVMPDIFPGAVEVDGQITVLFTDATVRDYFVNETEVSLYAVFTADNTPGANFLGFTLPRVKMGGASKDDGEKGLVMTMPFTALEATSGGAGQIALPTTLVVQDSAFV